MRYSLIIFCFGALVLNSEKAFSFDILLCETKISKGYTYTANGWKPFQIDEKQYLVESIETGSGNLDKRLCKNAIENAKRRTIVGESATFHFSCYRRSDADSNGMWDYGIEACRRHQDYSGKDVVINCEFWSFSPDGPFHVWEKMSNQYSSGIKQSFVFEAGDCQVVR